MSFTFRWLDDIGKSIQVRLPSHLARLLAPEMDEREPAVAQCAGRILSSYERSVKRSHLHRHRNRHKDSHRPTVTGGHELSRERPQHSPQFEQNICDLYFTLLHILLCNIILMIKSLLLLYFIINKKRVYFLLLYSGCY